MFAWPVICEWYAGFQDTRWPTRIFAKFGTEGIICFLFGTVKVSLKSQGPTISGMKVTRTIYQQVRLDMLLLEFCVVLEFVRTEV